MAADAYLKAAAGDLQKAASSLRESISNMQTEFKQFEREADHFIREQEADMREALSLLGGNEDQSAAAALSIRVKQLKNAADKKKQELNERRAQLNREIAAKQSTMNDLLSESNSLANKSGNPALK